MTQTEHDDRPSRRKEVQSKCGWLPACLALPCWGSVCGCACSPASARPPARPTARRAGLAWLLRGPAIASNLPSTIASPSLPYTSYANHHSTFALHHVCRQLEPDLQVVSMPRPTGCGWAGEISGETGDRADAKRNISFAGVQPRQLSHSTAVRYSFGWQSVDHSHESGGKPRKFKMQW